MNGSLNSARFLLLGRRSVGGFVQAGVVGLNGMVDSFVGYTQHRLVSCAGFGSAFGIEP